MTVPAIEKLRGRIPYPRPTKLSDPWSDFSDSLLEALLATDDDEMTDYQFRQLFDTIMPAGHYEEISYFLPMAFTYLADPLHESHDLIELLAGFTAAYRNKLQADGLLHIIHDCFQECLDSWAATFHVTDHQRIYYSLVLWTVHAMLHTEIYINTEHEHGLVPTQVFPDVAYTFVQQLAENT